MPVALKTPLGPPRSIYIAFEVYPRPKGASSHITAMVQALARDFAPVWLLCCGYPDMPAVQTEGAVTIHRYRMHHPNLLRRAQGFGTFVYEKLKSLPHPPAIGIFRDPWGGNPGLAAQPDSPWIFEVNALPSWELPYNFPAVSHNFPLLAKIEDLERFCLKKAATMVTVSDVTRKALVAMGFDSSSIAVVPNTAADFFFHDQPPGSLPELDQGRWFGYIGSLHSWQGIDNLIEAWNRVQGDFPEVKLMVVHSGRKAPLKLLRKRISKRGLNDRISLQAPLEPQELAGVIPKFEFTCAPLAETFRNTHQGCCPIKIVESMAAGVPVAASNLTVCRALINHGVDGWLIRPDNPRQWALEIGRLLENPPLRKNLAQGALNRASKEFTRENMFVTLKEAINRAIQ